MNLYKAVIFVIAGIFAGVLLTSKIHFLPLLIVNFQMIEEMVIKLKRRMDKLNVSQTVPVRIPSLYNME